MLFKTQEQKFDNFVASNSKNKKIRLLIISYIVVGTFLTKILYFCFLRYMHNIRYTQRKYPVGQKNSPLAYLSLSCPKEVLNVNAGVQSRQIWMWVPDKIVKLLLFFFWTKCLISFGLFQPNFVLTLALVRWQPDQALGWVFLPIWKWTSWRISFFWTKSAKIDL